MKLFTRLIKDKSGATAIEYGLIGALVSVAIISGATMLGNSLGNHFDDVASKVDDSIK